MRTRSDGHSMSETPFSSAPGSHNYISHRKFSETPQSLALDPKPEELWVPLPLHPAEATALIK